MESVLLIRLCLPACLGVYLGLLGCSIGISQVTQAGRADERLCNEGEQFGTN